MIAQSSVRRAPSLLLRRVETDRDVTSGVTGCGVDLNNSPLSSFVIVTAKTIYGKIVASTGTACKKRLIQEPDLPDVS